MRPSAYPDFETMTEVPPCVLTVGLPNFNGASLLKQNLPSLFAALDAAGVTHEIVVLDDGSSDASRTAVEDVSNGRSDMRFVENGVNEGFAPTCNRLIELARGRFLCLVNTDVEFDQAYFKKALGPLLKGEAEAVKGAIHNYSDDRDQPYFVDTQTRVSIRRGLARAEPIDKDPDGRGAVIAKLGCCFVACTETLRELGGFDVRYAPYYWDDVDLGKRFSDKGYRLAYVDDARVYHRENSTIGNLPDSNQANIERIRMRNRLMFTWSQLSGTQSLSYLAWELSRLIRRTLKADFEYHRALIEALKQYRAGGRSD